jgi:hypothetical protein
LVILRVAAASALLALFLRLTAKPATAKRARSAKAASATSVAGRAVWTAELSGCRKKNHFRIESKNKANFYFLAAALTASKMVELIFAISSLATPKSV